MKVIFSTFATHTAPALDFRTFHNGPPRLVILAVFVLHYFSASPPISKPLVTMPPIQQDDGFSSALLSVRLHHIDYYTQNIQTYSTSIPFQAARLTHEPPPQKLPVIRIFGSTPAAQTVCVHLHGLRPYLYLPLPCNVSPTETFNYAKRLRAALESALRSAYAGEGEGKDGEEAGEFLAEIEPVLKRDIYGYHARRRIFLKICVFAPRTVGRIASIVAQRGLPEELIPPGTPCYGAHIPFVMQTLVDYGLVGMGYMNLSKAMFRRPMPDGGNAAELFARPNGKRLFVNGLEEVNGGLFWPFHVAKRSLSTLEVDVFSDDILNGEEVDGEYAFVSRTLGVLWEEERLRTGIYPPRQKLLDREVKAGGHLSEDGLRQRLVELLVCDSKVIATGTEEELHEGVGSVLASQKDFGSASLPASYDAVLRVLDATGSFVEEEEMEIEEFEDDVDDIAEFEDEDGQITEERKDEEEIDERDINPAWVDIAACTQHMSVKVSEEAQKGSDEDEVRPPKTQRIHRDDGPDGCSRGSMSVEEDRKTMEDRAPQSEGLQPEDSRQLLQKVDDSQNADELMKAIGKTLAKKESGHPEDGSAGALLRQQDLISNDKTPLAFQADRTQSTVECERGEGRDVESTEYIFIRPAERPLSYSDLSCTQDVREALSIKYTTPFYGDKADEVPIPRAFGGITIPVRESGAAGYPPFPSYFDESKTAVEILPRVICPAERPPSLSQLKRDCNKERDPSGNTAKQGNFAIDSAGRQVYQRGTKKKHESQVFSFDPNIDFMALNVERGDFSIAFDEESEYSEEANLNTPRSDLTLHPENVLPHDSSVQSRPLSPKYDEAFQHGVLPNQTSVTPRRKKTQYTSRQSVNTDSADFNRNSTVSLSESMHRYQNLTVMSIELLATCYINKLPDPNQNSILAICAVTQKDREDDAKRNCTSVTFAVDNGMLPKEPGLSVLPFESELQLLDAFARHIRDEDPDVLVGYETQNASIGFILERAQVITHPFPQAASRWITKGSGGGFDGAARSGGGVANAAAAAYYHRKGADIKITGRHVVSLWRIVRKEVKLPSYARETVAADLFRTTFPKHTAQDLEEWLSSRKKASRAVRYLLRLSSLNIAVLEKLNIVSRTGELARVFGIDFMDVLTRGSQFRVESMLGRVARTRGFLLLSAARDDVFQQPAVEALPLVMEPQSALYVDPVIVLDFQSLYPSVIIAHNLCFTTLLGNLNHLSSWSEPRRIGVVPNYIPPTGENGEPIPMENIFVSSGGEMFVDASVRRGILPQLLKEILETRVMVKKAMKGVVGDEATKGLLNARQFGLKMIANVTYGYTAASFSGRMPCSGLADAIVQCGRDSLEEIVRYVEEELRQETGATVVYGDTDSLFVKVPGATRGEAFDIGERIVKRASELFPDPITLKLEKVYQPSVMQTKKRYVGYSYETRDQAVPTFDAKGIETVRRDSCPLVQKALEKSIRLLFETKDISTVKKHIQRLCQSLHLDRIPFADYIFRKEVRLGSYKEGHLPPAAIVATKAMEKDPRTVPRHGERVSFVVLYDRPGAPLKDCVVSPTDYLHAASLGQARLNTTYYITKQILPTLDRIFSLVGVRVMSWYSEIPRPLFNPILPVGIKKRTRGNQSSLHMFLTAEKCHICHGKSVQQQICAKCLQTTGESQASHYLLAMRTREQDIRIATLSGTCASCTGDLDTKCVNLTCPIYDQLAVAKRKQESLRLILEDKEIWTLN